MQELNPKIGLPDMSTMKNSVGIECPVLAHVVPIVVRPRTGSAWPVYELTVFAAVSISGRWVKRLKMFHGRTLMSALSRV